MILLMCPQRSLLCTCISQVKPVGGTASLVYLLLRDSNIFSLKNKQNKTNALMESHPSHSVWRDRCSTGEMISQILSQQGSNVLKHLLRPVRLKLRFPQASAAKVYMHIKLSAHYHWRYHLIIWIVGKSFLEFHLWDLWIDRTELELCKSGF